ncbi:MAG: polyamine ABC transporter permease [Pusillimonas sp.]|jgi:putative spermidine/putrescine transport system permease protein|nr:polyamine ABC transporter permease [Pusillimonas sp.]MBC42988.1 polyamine ABC transporter permease [Pusillimonas sp.]HCN71267.1 polyamine ABC transporter permease [Pusillimonas sp.]|tara:strand:+ start:69239 stop:70072 length:834 start_codon:yes stop_codon:yes gene_type:complete
MTQTNYYSGQHRFSVWLVRLAAGLVLFFLLLPILIVIPLSFNAEPFFTFTEGMLRLDPNAYSLQWYKAIADSAKWKLAVQNSFLIGLCATFIATTLGTLAAVGLASATMPWRRAITALLLSPMIVPLIIVAAGMFFFYTRFNLVASFWGIVIAHAALGVPFVIITVTATLSQFDQTLYRAGLSMGASPFKVFCTIIVPLIRPGVISGALFAFGISFDEVIVVLFLAGPDQITIPRQMFSGLREQINPTILAVATLLIVFSVALLATLEVLRRRMPKA